MKVFLILLLMLTPAPGWGEDRPFSVHGVKEGETVASVAASCGAAPGNVASANGLSEEDRPLAAGMTLLIPKSPEDTLAALYEAKRRGLGGWPRPRYVDEFLEPLVPASSAGEDEKTPSAAETPPPPTGALSEAPPDAPEPAAASAAGNSYTVREGDTLYRIAKNAGISLATLMAANGLTEDSIIRPGQALAIPAQTQPPAAAGLPSGVQPPSRDASFRIKKPLRTGGAMEKAGSGLFEPASPGTPVFAPATGTVLHGGWMKEYGNAVFIRHGGDYATFCGGLGIIYVKPGQEVTPDTRIGLVGEGASPGLHLNVLKKGKAADPAPFME
ncbi:MAG: LysM peptidoglycan-binding domain-containing protein [Aminivibrio sp.]|jgi:LysM repeat protein